VPHSSYPINVDKPSRVEFTNPKDEVIPTPLDILRKLAKHFENRDLKIIKVHAVDVAARFVKNIIHPHRGWPHDGNLWHSRHLSRQT
jgi:hypothetical protein